MAAAMPRDVGTEPESHLVFNTPYDQNQSISFRILNKGGRKIGWAIKTTNMRRFAVEPPCGTLEPKERVQLTVTCQPFNIESEGAAEDRITVEWTDAPAGAGNKFELSWFAGSGIIHRKWSTVNTTLEKTTNSEMQLEKSICLK